MSRSEGPFARAEDLVLLPFMTRTDSAPRSPAVFAPRTLLALFSSLRACRALILAAAASSWPVAAFPSCPSPTCSWPRAFAGVDVAAGDRAPCAIQEREREREWKEKELKEKG